MRDVFPFCQFTHLAGQWILPPQSGSVLQYFGSYANSIYFILPFSSFAIRFIIEQKGYAIVECFWYDFVYFFYGKGTFRVLRDLWAIRKFGKNWIAAFLNWFFNVEELSKYEICLCLSFSGQVWWIWILLN